MSRNKNITLIKGEFETEEAKDILRNLLDFKIRFHQIKSFIFVFAHQASVAYDIGEKNYRLFS